MAKKPAKIVPASVRYAAVRAASAAYRGDTAAEWSKTALAVEARRRTGCTVKAAKEAAEAVMERRTRTQGAYTKPAIRGTVRVNVPCRDRMRPAAAPRPLAARLARYRVGKVDGAWKEAGYRYPVCGATLATTFDASGVADARADRETTEGWIDYKSKGNRRGIVSCRTELHLSADWTRAVHAEGLAVVDGLFTLAAEPIACDRPGVELVRAAWVRQGAGVSLQTERGFIARHVDSGITYHGDREKTALLGLTRKVNQQAIPPAERVARRNRAAERRAETQRAQMEGLYNRVVMAAEPLGDLGAGMVTLADSIRVGNCRPGTEEFRDRYFPGRDAVSLAEIADLVRSRPGMVASGLARQVAAACLVAIRRERRALVAV